VAAALNNLGNIAQSQNDFARAQDLYSESLGLARSLDDKIQIASTLGNLGLNAHYQDDCEQATTLYRQSLELYQKLGDQHGEANVLSNLGEIASAQGDIGQARAYLTRSLLLFRTLNSRSGVAECLERLAGIATTQSEGMRAAQLLGAAETLRDTIGVHLSAADRPRYEQVVTVTRMQIDPATFAAAWAAGRALTLEQAIAYALQEQIPP
jgi:tetratricopeptide (TPR) repeat protein